jgi:hypothetical protein
LFVSLRFLNEIKRIIIELKLQALACSHVLLQRCQSFNRRTMDQLTAKVLSVWALLQEQAGRIAELRRHVASNVSA